MVASKKEKLQALKVLENDIKALIAEVENDEEGKEEEIAIKRETSDAIHKLKKDHSAALNALCTPVRRLTETIITLWHPACLVALVDAGVLDSIPDRSTGTQKSIDEIADATNTDRARLVVYLQGGEDIHLVEAEEKNGQLYYSLTEQGKLLQSNSSVPISAIATYNLKHCGLPMSFAGDALKDKTGSKVGVKKAYGVDDYFQLLNQKPEWAPEFFSCLHGFNSFLCAGPSLDYDWAGLGSDALVLDVGGGVGSQAVDILQRHPNVNIKILEQKSIIEQGLQLTSGLDASIKSRLSFDEADFFQPLSTKEKPAALFLRWILHDWNDQECIKILDALRAGVDKGTKIILAEFIVQRDSRPLTTAFNLHMVVMFGSQERTPQEYETLFNKSKGWKFDKVTPTRTDFNLVLGEAV